MTICVMAPSLVYVVASVELKGKHKIKMKTLNVKELNGKHKKKRGKHNMKPLNPPNPPPFQKKKKPQRLPAADAWLPFSPGWCYQPGLKVLLPERCAATTWSPFSSGS